MDVACLSSIACHLHGWRQGLSLNLKHVSLAGQSTRVRDLCVCLTQCSSHGNIPSHLAFSGVQVSKCSFSETKTTLWLIFLCGTGFPWYCGLADRARLASEPQDPAASPLISRITSQRHHTWVFIETLEIKLRSSGSSDKRSTKEPSSQLRMFLYSSS